MRFAGNLNETSTTFQNLAKKVEVSVMIIDYNTDNEKKKKKKK